MSDLKTGFVVDANVNPFQAAMQRLGGHASDGERHVTGRFGGMKAAVASATGGMQTHFSEMGSSFRDEAAGMAGSMGGVLEAIGNTRLGLAAFAAAAALMGASKFAAATAETTEQAMDLARALGSSTNQAQQWRIALADVGASQGELQGAAKGMSQRLKENEDAMKALGLQTRDASGNFRPMTELIEDGIALLNGYKEGADRALAGNVLFGEGVNTSSKLLLINREVMASASETMNELGLHVGANAVSAWRAWDSEVDRASAGLHGMGNTIGSIVMPVVTDLISVFNAAMPAAITVVKGAVGGLVTAWHALSNGIFTVGAIGEAVLYSLSESILRVSGAVGSVMMGDFKGAQAQLRAGSANVAEAWSSAFDRIAARSELTRDRIAAIWNPDVGRGEPEGDRGNKTYKPPPKEKKKDKPDAPPSFMAYYEMALEEERRAATERNALHGLSKQEELAFWQGLLDDLVLSEADRLAVQKKATAARIEILKLEAKEAGELGKVALAALEQRQLGQVAAQEEGARTQLALGAITQQQLLEQQLQFEERRQQIRRAALEAELAATNPERDPVQVAQINNKLEQLEQEHLLRMNQIRGQIAVQGAAEQDKIWGDLGGRMSSLWDQGVNAMMNSTLTWSGAFRAVGSQIVGWFANSVVKPKVTAWLVGEGAKTGATAAGTALRLATEGAAAVKSVALWAWAAVKNIMTNAWSAMAAAWQAMVGIPYVGPILAVGAAAATFAGVSALAGKVASAEGGFDIPRGLNPMTQLHEEEMVLPAKHANVIRSLADGGGGGGGAGVGNLQVQLNAVPLRGGFFMAHRDELVAALQSAKRDRAYS